MSAPNGVFTGPGHEHDPRWTAVDAYTMSHLHPATRPNHAVLQACLAHSVASGLPDIATFPAMAKMLALQCKIGKVKHVLEVGTLGGYTPLWIASECTGTKVVTVEVDPEHAEVARENWAQAGEEVANRIECIVGSGMDVLKQLVTEVKAGRRERFGLTYIDADKVNNWNYVQMAIEMSYPGSMIIVDNVVRAGKLVNDKYIQANDSSVLGSRELVEKVGQDRRVDGVVIQTVAEKSYDGYMIAIVQ